jgi:hypothetical protein
MLVAFAAGLMTKPMLVTLPLTLVLLDVWPLGRWTRETAVKRSVEKIPLFALAGASAVVTLLVQRPAMQVLEAVPFPARAANALVSMVAYAAAMLWPAGLAVIYPYPRAGIPLWQPIGAALVVAGVSVAALRSRDGVPGWSAVFICDAGAQLGLVQVGPGAPTATYVPLISSSSSRPGRPARAVVRRCTPGGRPRGNAPAWTRSVDRRLGRSPAATSAAIVIGFPRSARGTRSAWRSSVDLHAPDPRDVGQRLRAATFHGVSEQATSSARSSTSARRASIRMEGAALNLARLLMKLGRLDEAAVLVAEEQAWWPSDPHTLVDLGVLAVLQAARRGDRAVHRGVAARAGPSGRAPQPGRARA